MTEGFRNSMLLSSVWSKIENRELSKEDVIFNFALCLPYGYVEYGRDDYEFNKRQVVTDILNTYYYNPTHLYSDLADMGMELKVDHPIDSENIRMSAVETIISNVYVESHLDYCWIIVYIKMSGLLFPIEILRASDEGDCIKSPSVMRTNIKIKHKRKL